MAGWGGAVGRWLLGGRAATRADGIRTGRFWHARAATTDAWTCQNSPSADLVRPSLREGSLTNPASASPGVKSQAQKMDERWTDPDGNEISWDDPALQAAISATVAPIQIKLLTENLKLPLWAPERLSQDELRAGWRTCCRTIRRNAGGLARLSWRASNGSSPRQRQSRRPMLQVNRTHPPPILRDHRRSLQTTPLPASVADRGHGSLNDDVPGSLTMPPWRVSHYKEGPETSYSIPTRYPRRPGHGQPPGALCGRSTRLLRERRNRLPQVGQAIT